MERPLPVPRAGEPLDEPGQVRRGDGPLKRIYFLVAVAVLQIIAGSLLLVGAAQPVRISPNVVVLSGEYYHVEFAILGTGQMSGNLSELQSRSFDVFVFDDPGYASFRDGSNSMPPLFEKSGTHIVFDLGLAEPGNYHVVIVGSPARQQLQVHVDLSVVGLKTGDTLLALVVLVGGLALMAASLMLSVWAWRRALSAPGPTSEPALDPASDPVADPAPDPSADPPAAPQDPPDDNTRIY